MKVSASLNVTQPVADEPGVGANQRADARRDARGGDAPALPGGESAKAAQAPLRPAATQWDMQLNNQVSSAQQALAFLDQLQGQLEGLESDIKAQLQAGGPGDAALAGKLKDVADLWGDRQAATGGSLNGQLLYTGADSARQRFKIQGIDQAALQSGRKETLAFAVGAQRPMVVAVDPELSAAAQAQRFNQALTPAGIQAAVDSQGGLTFSVAESAWPAVRDGLTVRGAGLRFPSGQMARANAEAVPDAIRPDNWSAADAEALRRSLQEVTNALARVRRARELISRALAEAGRRAASSGSSQERDWAMSFVSDFDMLPLQPAYQIYSTIAPALTSISRERVISLLELR